MVSFKYWHCVVWEYVCKKLKRLKKIFYFHFCYNVLLKVQVPSSYRYCLGKGLGSQFNFMKRKNLCIEKSLQQKMFMQLTLPAGFGYLTTCRALYLWLWSQCDHFQSHSNTLLWKCREELISLEKS